MSSFYTSVDRIGNFIVSRGYENGKKFARKEKFQPKLFLPTRSESDYRSFTSDTFLTPKIMESMSAAREFIEKYKGVEGFDVHGNSNYVAQYTQQKFPGVIKFDPSLIAILSYDIELDVSTGFADVDKADKPISSIALKCSTTNTYHLLGLQNYDPKKTISGIPPEDIQYMKFDTERALLQRFIQLWKNYDPDVVTGWNVIGFDNRYIVNRITLLFGEEKARELSPWGIIDKKTIEVFGKEVLTYNFKGIAVLDYLDVFKKFGYKYGTQQSYKLDHIAHTVLKRKKLEASKNGTKIDTYRFIFDGARKVKIPEHIEDSVLDDKEMLVRNRDRLKTEAIKRGLDLTKGATEHGRAFKRAVPIDLYPKLTDVELLDNYAATAYQADEEYYQFGLDYNLVDTLLVHQLEEQTGLLSLAFTVAYKCGVNFAESLGTVGIWDTNIYRELMRGNIVPKVKGSPPEVRGSLAGGFVKDPQVGLHKWLVTFDLNSLYPHLMMQYNMSPETFLGSDPVKIRRYVMKQLETGHDIDEDIVEYLCSPEFEIDIGNVRTTDIVTDRLPKRLTQAAKAAKFAIAANGACFRTDEKGVLPKIVESFYDERSQIKRDMLGVESDIERLKEQIKKHGESAELTAELKKANKAVSQLHNQQMALKILMNSVYGATSNQHFIYFILEMAEAITTSGQLSIKWAGAEVNKYLNKLLKTVDVDYVVYTDTDSIHVSLERLMEMTFGDANVDKAVGEKYVDEICEKKFEPLLERGYDDLADLMSAYRNAMGMKREKIADRAIYIAKKRNIISTLNSEGVHYDVPKVAITGVDAARSSTPEVCRDKFLEAFKVIVNGDEKQLQQFVDDFKKQFRKLPAGEIGKVSGTDDIEKYKGQNGDLYRSACPIHVRGCLVYNNYVQQLGVEEDASLINSGDKIKFIHLKLPNPVRENVISFVDDLPNALNLHQFIDYDEQFYKVFEKPLQNVLDAIGWSTKKVDTLDSFFM